MFIFFRGQQNVYGFYCNEIVLFGPYCGRQCCISIFLKHPTFEGVFFHIFMSKTNIKNTVQICNTTNTGHGHLGCALLCICGDLIEADIYIFFQKASTTYKSKKQKIL